MKSKYSWITVWAESLAKSRVPGVQTYRVVSRSGGKFDQLRAIVRYTVRRAKDGRLLWQSRGEVVRLIPSYIHVPGLRIGSAHNRPATEI